MQNNYMKLKWVATSRSLCSSNPWTHVKVS